MNAAFHLLFRARELYSKVGCWLCWNRWFSCIYVRLFRFRSLLIIVGIISIIINVSGRKEPNEKIWIWNWEGKKRYPIRKRKIIIIIVIININVSGRSLSVGKWINSGRYSVSLTTRRDLAVRALQSLRCFQLF